MYVIGLETSGFVGSVALIEDGELLEERTLGQAGRRHAQSLVLEVHELLKSHRLKPGDVDGIAVSKGPGSFTGLRVGIVCAKTFAYAIGCQFRAVDTFSAIAQNCPRDLETVWIVENAQRGDLFVGRFSRDSQSRWQQTTPIELVDSEKWLPERTENEVITGPGIAGCELERLRATLLTDESMTRPRASAVARLGWEYFVAFGKDESSVDSNFWKALPFYFRPSAAEEQSALRAGRP